MAEPQDWKRHYEELLQQHESQSAEDAELVQLLARTIIRLTLAAGGLDSKLDPHLKRIRNAVRGDVSAALKQQLDSLSDSLLHLEESEAPDNDSVEIEVLCDRMLERLKVPQHNSAEANHLVQLLLSQPEQMSDEDLSRLLRLLGAVEAGNEGKKAGLFDRLFGARSADGESGVPPNQILLNLLEQASWPGHWNSQVGQFKTRLRSNPLKDEWVSVLHDLLELSARSFGEAKQEIKEAQEFLGELTRRLQDLEQHLRLAQNGRNRMVEQGRRLDTEVKTQVGGLEGSLDDVVDLQQLKLAVRGRLQAIVHSMDHFLEREKQWYAEAESNEHELRSRLNKLEQESNELRTRMLEAHHLAMQDVLTELPNRLAYEERVVQEYARWKRFGEPLTLLVWDVDNFKKINDRYGHQAGDKALRIIAQSLQRRLRETDFIARFGGEEFVSLLCGADKEQALGVAEQMRQAVSECAFHSAGKAVKVTISCGLAQFAEGDSIEGVFARADQAVYQAKRNGKNRCEMA